MMARSLFVTLLAAGSLALAGCMGSPGGEEEDEALAAAVQAARVENGVTTNGFSTNGFSTNGFSTNGFSTNGLSAYDISGNTTLMTQLQDVESQKILKYVVSCALPSTSSFQLTLNGHLVTFTGELGLAPEWGDNSGSCDATCKAWVSGCIISRLNYNGDAIPLSLRGSAEGLASTEDEREEFPTMEATYFGDLFANPPTLFACTSRGSSLIERVCGSDIGSCIVDVVGDCDDYFNLSGTPTARCGIPDTVEGNYPNCRDDAGNTYLGSVTVYRQCGNGTCDATESSTTCPEDCP